MIFRIPERCPRCGCRNWRLYQAGPDIGVICPVCKLKIGRTWGDEANVLQAHARTIKARQKPEKRFTYER